MRARTIPAILLALFVIGGAAYLGIRRSAAGATPPAQAPSTVAVDRGDVQQTVTAPGHLSALRQATLSTQTGGRLSTVAARAGDKVTAGQVLAKADTAGLELQLQSAQAALSVAEAHLSQATGPATAAQISSARARVVAAQAASDRLKVGPSAPDLAAAQAAVASAQAVYDASVKASGASDSQLEAAAAAVEKAQVTLQRAQAAYDQVKGSPNISMLSQSAALQSATIDYNQAKAVYGALLATAGPNAQSQVAQAHSALQQAQTNLAKLQAPAQASDLAAAQAQLTQAQNDLNTLLAAPNADALAIAQGGVAQAEVTAKEAQLKLDGATLVAPFAGVVEDVRASTGDQVGAGAPLIVLLDPTALEVMGTVVEEDLGLVQIGQAVELFFDAQPDASVTGHVARLIPLRDTSNPNRTAYPVAISLDALPEGLVPGMSADASIIIADRPDVLRLPRAVVRAGVGDTASVQVWAGDRTETRKVGVGLRGDVYVEITSGLTAGERVVGQ
jgi:HlyD family secretion protein